jgi:hypothetical protein
MPMAGQPLAPRRCSSGWRQLRGEQMCTQVLREPPRRERGQVGFMRTGREMGRDGAAGRYGDLAVAAWVAVMGSRRGRC